MFIGVDLIEIARISRAIQHPRFISRVYTEEEQKLARQFTSAARQTEFLAGRFAAKEAAYKAISAWYQEAAHAQELTLPFINFQDIETSPAAHGLPKLSFHGEINEFLEMFAPWSARISISHTREHALATVLLQVTGTRPPLFPHK